MVFGNYRPGAAFPENDTRSAYGAEFNNRQLELVEKIRREELPPGQNMAQWALAWCLKNPAVASVIVGCKTIAQLESNAAAGDLVACVNTKAIQNQPLFVPEKNRGR